MARTVTTRGFSLIELMVVVALVAVVASIAIPEYNDLKTANKIHEDINKLASFCKEARVWAFTHKKEVIITLDNSSNRTVVTATWDDTGTSTKIYTPLELHYQYTAIAQYLNSGLTITSRGTFKSSGHFRLDQDKQTHPAEREDCVVINNTRVRIGKYNDPSCVAY